MPKIKFFSLLLPIIYVAMINIINRGNTSYHSFEVAIKGIDLFNIFFYIMLGPILEELYFRYNTNIRSNIFARFHLILIAIIFITTRILESSEIVEITLIPSLIQVIALIYLIQNTNKKNFTNESSKAINPIYPIGISIIFALTHINYAQLPTALLNINTIFALIHFIVVFMISMFLFHLRKDENGYNKSVIYHIYFNLVVYLGWGLFVK
jgi:hypothetical protein